jgi:hypothetical protein
MEKLMNGLDFGSKVIVLFNEQKRKIQSVMKIVALINSSMYFSCQCCSISEEIDNRENGKIEKMINYKFCKEYFRYFDK